MEKSLYQIFKTFFKVGTLLLGGGYVILPLLQSELVEKKQWIDDEELCEFYALAQSVPGIIAANMSVFVGYKLKKFFGALAAITGIILPAFIAIIILAKVVEEVTNLRFIQYIFQGVGIGVLLLIILAIKEIWIKSVNDKITCWVFFVTFILSACFKASPAALVILAILVGLWLEIANKIEHSNKVEHACKFKSGESAK